MSSVGIDVGKDSLDVAMHGHKGVKRFANTSAGVRALVRHLQTKAAARVVLEA